MSIIFRYTFIHSILIDRDEKMANKNKIKVAVAMSGGVDSSVAAAMMVEKYGKENVFGVTLKLFCYGEALTGGKSCCSLEAIDDAKAVCQKLGIPHYVLNVEKEFEEKVVKNFIDEYLAGRTPNPCIRCNKFIKFDWLLKKVKGMGVDYLATGHYARIAQSPQVYSSSKRSESRSKLKKFSIKSNDKTFKLLKGIDGKKDQSYFLHDVTQDQLKHLLFPLGEYRKEQVRKMAKDLGLKVFDKIESQEVCFIDTNYHEFLARIVTNKVKDGHIVDLRGNVIGEHNGLPFYTIGQRKGLGDVSYKREETANNTLNTAKKPLYVIDIKPEENTLVVGEEKDLYSKELFTKNIHWISEEEPLRLRSWQAKLSLKCKAKIRYLAKEEECGVRKQEAGSRKQLYRVNFVVPQRAITSGQSIVFYLGDECLGGGVIESRK